MITLLFQHKDHGCKWDGEVIPVRPPVNQGAWAMPHLRCIENDMDLALIGKET